eukprot:GHVU01192036.1.p1 GENE.GHVU01192036.1~~GHVU01192036.1.p1  ORF type:complete len:105 (+),score=9.32 GHVU01192036.1:656-970(+)
MAPNCTMVGKMKQKGTVDQCFCQCTLTVAEELIRMNNDENKWVGMWRIPDGSLFHERCKHADAGKYFDLEMMFRKVRASAIVRSDYDGKLIPANPLRLCFRALL